MTFGPFSGPFGSVTLDTVQFSTDPEPYEPMNWAKRMTIHPAIGGQVIAQDFGTFKRDNTIKLGSGNSRFLDESAMSALHARYRTRGVMYGFSDWLGNEFQVFIKRFIVVPWKKGGDSDNGTMSLWTYEMELQVLDITTLLGEPFLGG